MVNIMSLTITSILTLKYNCRQNYRNIGVNFISAAMNPPNPNTLTNTPVVRQTRSTNPTSVEVRTIDFL